MPHLPQANIPRGGAKTSDHIVSIQHYITYQNFNNSLQDILGSTGLNEIILKVVTGVGHEIESEFVSQIREYATQMKWDED